MTDITRDDLADALGDFQPSGDEMDLIIDCLTVTPWPSKTDIERTKFDAIIGRIFRKHVTTWFESNAGDFDLPTHADGYAERLKDAA